MLKRIVLISLWIMAVGTSLGTSFALRCQGQKIEYPCALLGAGVYCHHYHEKHGKRAYQCKAGAKDPVHPCIRGSGVCNIKLRDSEERL